MTEYSQQTFEPTHANDFTKVPFKWGQLIHFLPQPRKISLLHVES